MLKVDTGCMEAQAQQMQRIANELNEISSRVAGVNQRLRKCATYVDPITLSMNREKLVILSLEKKAAKLASVLRQAAQQYTNAEAACKAAPLFIGAIDAIPPQISKPIEPPFFPGLDVIGFKNRNPEDILKNGNIAGLQGAEKLLELYEKAKEVGIEGLEGFWEKVTGYDLDSGVYENFFEDIVLEALGLDDIDDLADVMDKLGDVIDDFRNGDFSGETFSDIYTIINKGFDGLSDSPLSPVEIKVVGEAFKLVDKYSAIVDGYEQAAIQAFKNGDYGEVASYMGKSLWTLGKATADTTCKVIGNVFMLDEVGSTLSMITGYDIPGTLNDWGTKISNGFDKIFGM